MAKPKTAIPFACPSRASRKADETPPLPKPPPHLYEAMEAATRMNLFFPSTQMKGCFPPWHPLPANGKAYALTSLEDVVCKHLIINMSTTGGGLRNGQQAPPCRFVDERRQQFSYRQIGLHDRILSKRFDGAIIRTVFSFVKCFCRFFQVLIKMFCIYPVTRAVFGTFKVGVINLLLHIQRGCFHRNLSFPVQFDGVVPELVILADAFFQFDIVIRFNTIGNQSFMCFFC